MAILLLVRILAPFAVLLGILPAALVAFRDGPPSNSAGGFGDPTCQQCHFDNAANDPGGAVGVAGVPARYEPGATYSITVTLSRPEMRRGGFQMTARFASGDEKGRQAGQWKALDERAQVIAGEHDPATFFVEHTARGSLPPAAGAMSWTVNWIAPAAAGPVEFNAAANAANDDASPLGDYVYVTASRSSP